MPAKTPYKIVSDSSCDIHSLPGTEFQTVPLHIVTDQMEYVDDENLDAGAMVEALRHYKGKSSTACPNVADWEAAFAGAEQVFAVTITSGLSGSYNAARCAKESFEAAHPGVRIHVIDSLSTGPEVVLILEKLRELTNAGLSFAEIVSAIETYQTKTHLMFLLSSIQNLARNGRASRIGAEAVGLLGIRIYGQASPEGKLDVMGKCRGEATALERVAEHIARVGCSGRVVITHCLNPQGAETLKAKLLERYHGAEITILPAGGLCGFYAEKGGLMVGWE